MAQPARSTLEWTRTSSIIPSTVNYYLAVVMVFKFEVREPLLSHNEDVVAVVVTRSYRCRIR